MKTPTKTLRMGSLFSRQAFALTCSATLFAFSATAATTIIWTGGGGDGLWNDAANWNPNVTLGVTSNDVLQFSGIVGLLNTNNITGDTNAGITFLPAAGAFNLNSSAGVTTLLGGNIANQSTNLQTINLNLQITGGNRSILAYDGSNNVGDIQINGAISQDSARTLTFAYQPEPWQPAQGMASDGGDVILTAPNTYSGQTTLGTQNGGNGGVGNPSAVMNGAGFGTLTLNFGAPGAPANNILYNGVATPATLELCAGSTLLMEGAPGANNTNNFGSLEYAIGLNTVDLVAGAGGTVTANFGTFTVPDANNNSRAGAMNFVLGPNTTVTTTSANNPTTGILNNSAWAGASYVINGSDWACQSNGVIVPCTNYQVDAVGTANANLDVITSGNELGAEVSTIRFNANASLALSNNVSAQSLANNAILMTPNCGANTNIISGSQALSASVVRALLIYNFDTNPNSELVIDCPIGSDGGAQTTYLGPGLTKLTQANQTGQEGVVSIMGGARLLISLNASLGNPTANANAAVQMDNGTLMVQTNMALDANNGGGLDAREIVLGTHGAAFDVSGTNTLIISGVVSNANPNANGGCFIKEDTGTLELTGPNYVAGPAFIEGGTLAIASAPHGTNAIVVSDGATLEDLGGVSINPSTLVLGSVNGCTNTFAGISSTTTAPIKTTNLAAAGIVTVNVSGALNVGVYPLISFVNNIGTGSFVVGTLPADVAGNIITNNSTIALNVTATGTPYIWKGNVNNNWDIAATANWFYSGNSSVYIDANPVRFDDTASLFNVNLAANVSPTSIFITNSQNAYTFGGSDSILAGSLVKTGTNTLTLAVTDSSGGGITISAGTLIVGDGTTNGAVTAGSIADNDVLEFAETNGACSVPISGSGSVEVNAANDTGSGVYTLGGLNSYLGNTIVSGGMLDAGSQIPAVAGGGILIVNTNAVLNVNGQSLTVNGLSGNGTVDNQAAATATFTVGANNTNTTFAGTISNTAGAVSLSKDGTGTIFLTGTNYFEGMLTFNGGIVNAASFSDYADAGTANSGPSAIGVRYYSNDSGDKGQYDSGGTVGLLFQGGTLQYTGSTPQETDRQIRIQDGATATIDASGSNPGATLYWSFGDIAGGNANLFETPGARTLQLTGSNTGTNTFDIQITDQAANTTAVTKSGAGTWYMFGASAAIPNCNYYSGLTSVSGGILFISTTHNDYNGAVPPVSITGSAADSDGLGPFSISDGATLGVIYGGDSADYPALMGTLTVGSSAGAKLEFENIPGGKAMVSATNTIFRGTGTIICPTNNLTPGTYPLLTYGKLSGSYTLAAMPGPFYYGLTNDGVNIDLEVATTPFVNTNPTNIVFAVANGQMTLSWPTDHTGWQLQAQTNSLATGLGTDWFDVSNSTTTNQVTVPINLTSGCVFYRLVYP